MTHYSRLKVTVCFHEKPGYKILLRVFGTLDQTHRNENEMIEFEIF